MRAVIKLAFACVLVVLAAVAMYYAMFWGWASGTGPRSQPSLKMASNMALGLSFVSFSSAIGMYLVPLVFRSPKK
jgi:hypothetical protein